MRKPIEGIRASRRSFFGAAAVVAGATIAGSRRASGFGAVATELPKVDLHVHLDNSTIDRVVELSEKLGVRFGIVEHAGTKENVYPVVLSNDGELARYLKMLEGKPVWCGVQTEWTDWRGGFSTEALARLDYILTDAMTFPGRDGRRVKLWEKDAPQRVDMSDPQTFMDRYVDWHVKILGEQPIDILANASWLPKPLAEDYDAFWTAPRVRRVVRAAVEHHVAIEISGGYRLPRMSFLKIARDEGAVFSFGSNGRYPKMGQIDYALQMARELGLKPSDVFVPGKDRTKAILRRKV